MKKNKSKRDKVLKPASLDYLDRACLYYLGRFSTSIANLHAVLERKVRRRNEEFKEPTAEQLGWIETVVEKYSRLGYLDDRLYADQKARALHRSGKPLAVIKLKLREKGLSDSDISYAIDSLSETDENPDIPAAISYARKRRFGPFRTKDKDQGQIEKEIASMARAGFSYQLAKSIIEAVSQEDLPVSEPRY